MQSGCEIGFVAILMSTESLIEGPVVWLVYSFQETRQYFGNQGYPEDATREYRYDSFVPNHKNLRVGHIVLLCSEDSLIGISRIDRIDAGAHLKTLVRCPNCHKTQLKERKGKSPRFRCGSCFKETDVPVLTQETCTQYIAHFPATILPAQPLSRNELRDLSVHREAQLAIRQIDVERLLRRCPELGPLVLGSIPIRLAPQDADESAEAVRGASPIGDYHPDGVDNRELALRQVLARRGQASFRQRLRKRYGDRCLITGCGLMDIVEAAHISPYRKLEDNHPENGLLLRSDLHTLYDLDLLGIEPASLKISLHPACRVEGYAHLESTILRCRDDRPGRAPLNNRWISFQQGLH